MIIIAICFEERCTCSCAASDWLARCLERLEVSSVKEFPRACLDHICKCRNLPEESVEEILVVQNNQVFQYTPGMWK